MILNYLNLRKGSEKVNKLYQGTTQVYGDKTEHPVYNWGGLSFRAIEPARIGLEHYIHYTDTPPNVEYSIDDGHNWQPFDEYLDLEPGQVLCVRGDNTQFSYSSRKYSYFVILGGKVAAFGNINSLLFKDNYDEIPVLSNREGCFRWLFEGCINLISAPELPYTDFGDDPNSSRGVYYGMFTDCTSLTTAPVLPATSVPIEGYSHMFKGCSSLNKVGVYINEWNENETENWLSEVSDSGVVVSYNGADIPLNSDSGVPSGWRLVKH